MRHHPYYRIAIGIVLITVWIGCSVFTILTDEELFSVGLGVLPPPMTWEVFLQPWNLIHGMYPIGLVAPVLGAWGIFSSYLLFSVLDAMPHSKSFKTVLMIFIGIDSIANYQHFQTRPWLIQLLFTFMLFMVITFALSRGIVLVLGGFEEMGDRRNG